MLYAGVSFASGVSADEASAYAGFIQSLVNNSSVKKRDGMFCIYGNDQVARFLIKSANNFNLGSGAIAATQRCKAIYIASEGVVNLGAYLETLVSNKVLTISTSEDFAENGGMIQVQMGRRDFELIVDVKALNSAQIKLDTLSTNLIIN